MSERRKETRRKLSAFAPVYDLHPRLLLGYLGDLTVHGARVVGTNLTTIGKETMLEIDFPSDVPGVPGRHVTIPARIARCQQDQASQYYDIGVEFTDISPEHAELIQQILDRYHFRHALSDADMDDQ